MRLLLRCLPWIAAVCSTVDLVVERFLNVFMWANHDNDSEFGTRIACGLSMWFTCALSIACFITATMQAKRCTDVVERRCWLRSLSFAANALVTELPFAVFATVAEVAMLVDACKDCPPDEDTFQQRFVLKGWLNAIPYIFLSLNGFANCCTFFWQSRYSNEHLKEHWLKEAPLADESFNVQFEAGDAQTIPG